MDKSHSNNQSVILIGTLHLNLTNHTELLSEVWKHNPDKIFIELSPGETKESSNRDEMFAVYEQAESEGIETFWFDVAENTYKEGVTGEEQELSNLLGQISVKLQGCDWKDFNKSDSQEGRTVEMLDKEIYEKFYDEAKLAARNKKLGQNISENLISGTNVVVTGAAHLGHLLEDIPGSVAPLRN